MGLKTWRAFALGMKLRCHNPGNAQVLDTLSIVKSRNDRVRSYFHVILYAILGLVAISEALRLA